MQNLTHYITDYNMNLFDNILNQSKSSFLGTQPTPTVPSFMTQQAPQAPRTSSYVAPNVPYNEAQKPDPSTQLKEKFGFNDKDIEFLKQAKQKGYDSKLAFDYITKKKEQEKV